MFWQPEKKKKSYVYTPLLHYDKAQTKNKTKSYISNISQGNVVNFFGDFFGGLVGCISQSLTAHGFQQTL